MQDEPLKLIRYITELLELIFAVQISLVRPKTPCLAVQIRLSFQRALPT